MKLVGGNWLPDHEEHLGPWMMHPKNKVIIDGKHMYQYGKQLAALQNVKQWRTAVDIGAHVGLWSGHLAKRFQTVHAFEPVEEHRRCFGLNVLAANIELHPVALGAQAGSVSMKTEQGSSGNTQVAGAGDIEMRTLDSYALQDVDFMKLDCEGYELYALQGALETLKRCHPAICVEQKPKTLGNFGFKEPEAVQLLQSLGAVVRRHWSGDYMMSWD